MIINHVSIAATMAFLVVCVTGCIDSDASSSPHSFEGNTEWVVGVSKDQPKADIETAGSEISELIKVKSRGGDWIHVVSLPDHLTVCSFVVPEGSERTRLRDPKVREVLPKLADAFRPSGETGARIDLPALASTVGSIRRSEFPCRVVLFGSPIYADPTKQGWNFDQGGAPLDESIGDPDSPFGTSYPLPENCQVVVATPGPNWGEDKPHKEAVAHFVRLYVQRLGGDLIRLTDAPQTAFVFSPPQFTGEEPVENPGFGMRRFAFSASRVKFDRDGKAVPISRRANDGAIGKSLDAVIRDGQADPTKTIVIAKWESIPEGADPKIDLDLRATVRSKPGEISYKNAVVDGLGRLYRDIQTTGSANVDGDPIETWEGLELETTDLDAITLWINCFAATAPSKIELIRIHRGEVKTRVVTLKCSFGDGGQNEHHRARSDAWVQIAMEKFKATDSPGTL